MRRVNNSIFQGDPPKLDMSQFWNKPVDYPFQEEEQPSPPANRTQLAIDRGYLPEREEGLSNQEYMDALAENPKEKKPFDFFNFGLGMRRASAGLSWLSGIKERNRQNQYLQNQLSTLGQLDALPAEQPNPYNLYAKYGGKLSKFAGGGEKEDPKKKDIDPKVLARMQNPQQGDLSSQMGIINQNNQIKIQQNAPAIKKYMEDKDFNRRMNNQPTLSARKKLTPYEQEQADKYRRKRNEQYVALHPERTLNEQGDIVKSGFGEFVDKYGDNLDKFANSLETPMAIQGAGELLYAGTKYALPKVGEYLMTQTPLKNAYKLNPWAFKPNSEAYYRGIGKEGMDDILNSGIIRSKKQNAYPEPYFSKGKIGDAYAKGYFAELTNEPMKGVGNFSTGDLIQTPVSKVSINNPNLKLYQKDWLRGYKEVPKPTGMEALPYGLGKLRKLAKPGLVKAGKQLTENTPLKNAYKLNPFALNLQSQAKENIGRIISNDSIKNLEDLKYAANWAKEYGYKLPENLERISQSKELTDRTIRGLMDRHNTFTRGVSTNWKFLEEKNPEILRHLEGKGFDLTSEEGTKKAAEYMATHIPIETGYGRASLNKSIFDKGMDGLYTSNSIPTAEGYTYGDGFIVKAKKPTNFTSVNRRDWVDNNQLDYMTSLKKDKQELQQSFMFTNSSSEDISNLEMHYGKENANIIKNWYDDIHKKEIELRKKYNINNKGKGNYSIDHIVGKKLDDSDYASGKFDEIIKNHKENVSKFNNELIEYKSKTQEEIVKNFVSNDSHVLKSILKTEHYPGKPEQFFQVGNKDIGLGKIHSDIIPNLGLSSRETDRLKNDIIKLTEGFRKKGWDTKKISENLKQYLKDQYQNDPYAHYIHLGTPGEKVLEPVWSKRITPEIWKNKSRAHTNIYSKGLTAASVIPAIMATSSLNKKEFKKGGLTPNKAREILHDGTAQGHPYAKYGGKLSKFANGGQEDPKKKKQQESPKKQDPPKREPIIVNDKNDPRLEAYSDSLRLYKSTIGLENTIRKWVTADPSSPTGRDEETAKSEKKIIYKSLDEVKKALALEKNIKPGKTDIGINPKIKPIGGKNLQYKIAYMNNIIQNHYIPVYKKPVQPVIYQEEKKLEKPSAIPRQALDFGTGSRPQVGQQNLPQPYEWDNTKPTKYSFSYPTGKYNEQKSIYFPDAGTWKQFIGNQKLINSDEGQGYGTATGYMQEGGEIPNPGFGQMNSTLVEALSNSKKLKFRRSGKFKALIPMEDFNDDVLNYIDKFKNLKRQGERYVKVRGKLAPLDLQAPPEPIEDKFLMLSKGGIKKLRGRK